MEPTKTHGPTGKPIYMDGMTLDRLLTKVTIRDYSHNYPTPPAGTWSMIDPCFTKKGKLVNRRAKFHLSGYIAIRDNTANSRINKPQWSKGLQILEASPELLEHASKGMLEIANDSRTLAIVERADGSVLVTLHYNLIIGSHWLFITTTDDVNKVIARAWDEFNAPSPATSTACKTYGCGREADPHSDRCYICEDNT